MKETPGIIK